MSRYNPAGRNAPHSESIDKRPTSRNTTTPMLLARGFTINPVLVILSLVFWYWMWGVPGAILSTPMLAITKIICDRIRPLMAFGHFMEG